MFLAGLTVDAEGDGGLHLLRVGERPVPDDAAVLGAVIVFAGVDGEHGGGGEVSPTAGLQDAL